MSAIDRSTAPAALAASFVPRPRVLASLRRACVAAVEFADAYAVIEIGVVLTVASFSSVLLIQALGFDLVG